MQMFEIQKGSAQYSMEGAFMHIDLESLLESRVISEPMRH
jgi:hypothetical protein